MGSWQVRRSRRTVRTAAARGAAWRLALPLAAFVAAGAAGASSPPPPAAPPAEGPSVRIDPASCDACHAALGRKKHVHEPFSGGSCLDCHAPGKGRGRCKSPAAASWKLVSDPRELCATCHDGKEMTQKLAVKHAPVLDHRCAECHDAHASDRPHLVRFDGRKLCLRCHSGSRPAGLARARVDGGKKAHGAFESDCAGCHEGAHGGAKPKLLRAEPPALCDECHEPKDRAKHVHSALSMGACTDCHTVHGSDHEKQLRVAPDRLCLECHDPEALAPKEFVHAPAVEGRCASCHDPHGSERKDLLRKAGAEACLGCHGAKAEGPAAASPGMRLDLSRPHVHAALEMGSCEDCHVAAHSADRRGLLKDDPASLCHGCHDRVDGKRHVHGAVRLGECAGCHDPHSSDRPKLVAKPAVKAMCFTCHQDDMTARAVVHSPVADGDCTGCHDPHAAPGEALLKAGSGKKACYECHAVVDGGKVKHAAIRRYGCNGCHDAHGSAGAALLPKPVNALCLDCHPKATPAHVTPILARGHPLGGGPDPRRIEKDFTCASCHDPHGSESPRLLRSGSTAIASCDGCHGNISGTNPAGEDLVRDRDARRKKRAAERAGPASAPAPGPAGAGSTAPPAPGSTPPAVDGKPRP